MFSQRMGINDPPQGRAYFLAVGSDYVLRKEVDMECVTPSHPEAVTPDESVGIHQLLAKGALARIDPAVQSRTRPKSISRPTRRVRPSWPLCRPRTNDAVKSPDYCR